MRQTTYQSWPNLNQSFNKLKTEIMKDNLQEQIVNISKAGAYDILTEKYGKLFEENSKLKADLNAIYEVLATMDANEVVTNPNQLIGRISTILTKNSKIWL